MLKKALLHTLCLGAIAALPQFAHATLVMTTTTTAFSVQSGVVTDANPLNVPTTVSNVGLGTTQLNKFNKSTGVLTGVSVNLASTQTQKTEVTTPGTSSGNNSGTAGATGVGSSTVKLVVPTGVSSGTNTVSATDTCAGKPKTDCHDGITSNPLNFSLAVGSSDLNAYAGTGTYAVSHVATSISANTTVNTFNSEATTATSVDWTGNLSTTYSYLLHAAQSFDSASTVASLTLDFGTVFLGDTVANQGFGISNLLGDRVGLSLTSFTETGDANNAFSTDLLNFVNLGAGSSKAFAGSFLASTLGSQSATYSLVLADYAPSGAYASDTLGSGYTLTLNLKGNVVQRPQQPIDVPEPGSLALLGAGAVGMVLRGRRRRTS